MPSSSDIKVKGYRELQRAVARADRQLKNDLRDRLKDVAEPVRADAERLARREIENIGDRWSQMRVGVTTKVVYVAPKQRGVKSRARAQYRRPKLAPLLMNRAMDPALDQNRQEIEHGLERFIDEVERRWGR